ncbi:hypothetical protein C6P44_001944 [Monosporozyma unispora]|nr:hypothetical protein C6P44_001944 [Kazachstania unispora]
MDKDELELKEKLKEEKKAILEERKRKREDSKNKGNNQNKNRYILQKAIYISNIPVDKDATTLRKELIQEFSKFGDLEKNQDDEIKCKLYMNEKSEFKGDALIIYTREEYAVLAIEMMNDYSFHGNRLKVDVAHFEEKKHIVKEQREDPNDDKSDSADELKHQKRRKIDINTNEDTAKESRKERTLVLANIIDIYQDLESDELQEIEEDIVAGCKPFGTIISHVVNGDRGEIHITFSHRTEALKCRQTMNGRFFDGRKILAYMLDEEDLSDAEAETQEQEGSLLAYDDDFIEGI